MKTVITYGTFDLFHTGHLNLLKRAKALGDRLIVGVTSDAYDQTRGKLNVVQTCEERMENVRATGLADLIIIEEEEGQKIQDIQKHHADIFAIGSDWTGKFDYLNEYCQVVYLERTKGVSSTELRGQRHQIIRMGLVGHGRVAPRFLKESKYVSGIEITSVYGRNLERAKSFSQKNAIAQAFDNLNDFLQSVDAVYIATPHHLHVHFAKKALEQGKHVLCEKPIALTTAEATELYELAKKHHCILMEAIKTAYAPAFIKLVAIAKSGVIGTIKALDATFTKLIDNVSLREYDPEQAGGAITEFISYPGIIISKLFGTSPLNTTFVSFTDKHTGVDTFTQMQILYSNAIATANVGIGVKGEGALCITGTKGYIYVPAPWWKTEKFELSFEDRTLNKTFSIEFEEDGMRYEISAFLNAIQRKADDSSYVSETESLFITSIIEKFRNKENVTLLKN